MWNEPTIEDLSKLPKLYETEEISIKDKIVHIHLFLAGCDWYACEYDGKDLFFGYVVLNNDFEMAEWGYFSLAELKSLKAAGAFEVDRDLYWNPIQAQNVEKICEAQGWRNPSEKEAINSTN